MDTKKPGKILVVEDECNLLDLLVDVLSEDGHAVEGVATGAAALQAVQQTPFHVGLIDYQLGDMTGLALSKELRRLHPDMNIILMTAHASLDMAVKAIQADVYDYLIKPIDSNHLKRSLDNGLEKYRLTQENKDLLEKLKAKNAELVRLSELKSRFLSVVSHDLRSPLASIRGYAQLILSPGILTPAQIQKFMAVIVSQTDYLAGLINDLMDMVSIESGKLRIEMAPENMREILDGVKTRMDAIADQKKIDFRAVIASDDFPPARMDRRRIDQVLTNLIGNAFKHTPAGGAVTVTLRREADQFRVDVVDTGEGIPPEALPYLFDEFFQVESHDSKREGLGLGLTIAREIIRAHGGEIGAESEGSGKGARFWFTLPLMRA